MKIFFIARKLLTLLMLLSTGFSIAQPVSFLVASNSSSSSREDELLVLQRDFIQKKCKGLADDEYVIVKHEGVPLLVQYDDLNEDGIWDEAVFLYSFKPNEKIRFTLEAAKQPASVQALPRAHVRQKHRLPNNSFGPDITRDTMPYNNPPTDFAKQRLPYYLTEGPAWENDKVGFRKYFDTRNANDIWGKTTNAMVLEKVGTNPDSVYHHLGWWGMDILKVGKSLGAGAIALQIPHNGKTKDTLLRMGSNTGAVIYHAIADGPVRAMFSITYKDVAVTGTVKPVSVKETISIWGGQYFFQNQVQVKDAPAGTKLLTGIPDFYQAFADTIQSKSIITLYTTGKQSENNDELAMAVMIPAQQFNGITTPGGFSTDISDAYLISQQLDAHQKATYRFYTLWQKSNAAFANHEQVKYMLQQQALAMQSPLLIK